MLPADEHARGGRRERADGERVFAGPFQASAEPHSGWRARRPPCRRRARGGRRRRRPARSPRPRSRARPRRPRRSTPTQPHASHTRSAVAGRGDGRRCRAAASRWARRTAPRTSCRSPRSTVAALRDRRHRGHRRAPSPGAWPPEMRRARHEGMYCNWHKPRTRPAPRPNCVDLEQATSYCARSPASASPPRKSGSTPPAAPTGAATPGATAPPAASSAGTRRGQRSGQGPAPGYVPGGQLPGGPLPLRRLRHGRQRVGVDRQRALPVRSAGVHRAAPASSGGRGVEQPAPAVRPRPRTALPRSPPPPGPDNVGFRCARSPPAWRSRTSSAPASPAGARGGHCAYIRDRLGRGVGDLLRRDLSGGEVGRPWRPPSLQVMPTGTPRMQIRLAAGAVQRHSKEVRRRSRWGRRSPPGREGAAPVGSP